MSPHNTIAVDFDGVIHKYRKGWNDGSIYDGPTLGIQYVLKQLRNEGYTIIIYSTRATSRFIDDEFQPGQYEQMSQWLFQHDVPYDDIWMEEGKPIAKLYIDDNAYRLQASNLEDQNPHEVFEDILQYL